MSNVVYFRLKSEKETHTVPIEGHEVSVRVLRDKIADIKKLKDDPTVKKKGPNMNYFLTLLDSITSEEYHDDTLIPSGKTIIVKRGLPCLPTRIQSSEAEKPVQKALPRRQVEETISAQIAKLILTGSLPPVLVCPICKNMLKNPHISACCGHSVCQTCWEEPCFKCGKPLLLFPSKQLNAFLENIERSLRELKAESSELTEMISNAKFFLVQVYTVESLTLSLNTSEWPIPSEYVSMLKSVYKEGTNIVFILTNSKMKLFHGCALMMSTVLQKQSEEWRQKDIVNVKWLRRGDVPFQDLSNLSHPIQKDALTQPVEMISPNSGLELCLFIDKAPKQEVPEYKPIEITVSNLPVKEELPKPPEKKPEKPETKPERPRPRRERSRSPERSRKPDLRQEYYGKSRR